MISNPFLLVLSSPSGAGKTTLARRVQARFPGFVFSVSYTTRPPRVGEVHGVDYFFVTRDEFLKKIDQNDFVEWAEVHGNLYGTSSEEIYKAKGTETCTGILFDIDCQGARQLHARFPEAITVFVLPPSLEELEMRLCKRGTENESVRARRLAVSVSEIKHYPLFAYLVINDALDRATEELCAIVLAERARQAHRAAKAESLLLCKRPLE